MKKMTALLALLVAAVLVLSACGSGETRKSGGDTGRANAQFNDADVKFATDMIPHHQQAVQMSKMAESHASSAEVKKLAEYIEAAQGPEIDTMTTWLKTWGKDVPTASNEDDSSNGDMGDMGTGDGSHMDTGDMPGMMSSDDLGRLDKARGAAWDHMFLTMMIAHHEGAIEMAKTEQADGKNADAVTLAKKIEAAQTSEITKMKHMLNR
jgi:uncharacterized protein (DUF305 family)